jgi:hypothetical protein
MEESSLSSFELSDAVAWTLGTSNLGLFVGGVPSLESIVKCLRRLESSETAVTWIIIGASKRTTALIAHMWNTVWEEDVELTVPKLPCTWNNVVLATPESLKRIDNRFTSRVAGLILIDMLCHVHRARKMPGPAGRFVTNDRPQMIADFRNSVGVDAWVPPLILMTEEPAKSVHADYIARAYCLDGFWFLDGRTVRVRLER